MKPLLYFLLVPFTLSMVACTTVKVTKVTTGDEVGVRYSLGKPFIQVTPNAKGDGTYTVELVYLPDQSQTYAVEAKTFLTKHTMELSIDENGILKKVDWSKGGDGTAGEAITAAAEIAKASIAANKAEDKEAKEAAENKKKAAAAAIQKLKDSLTQKQIDLKLAKNDSASLVKTYPDKRPLEVKEQIRKAEMLIIKLNDEIEALTKALTEAETAVDQAANASKSTMAWGPVFYEIQDTYDPFENTGDVALTAVKWTESLTQKQFATIAEEAPLFSKEIESLTYDTKGAGSVTLTSDDHTIVEVEVNQSSIKDDAGKAFDIKLIESVPAGRSLTLKFKKKDFPPGTYKLKLQVVYKLGAKEDEKAFELTLTIK